MRIMTNTVILSLIHKPLKNNFPQGDHKALTNDFFAGRIYWDFLIIYRLLRFLNNTNSFSLLSLNAQLTKKRKKPSAIIVYTALRPQKGGAGGPTDLNYPDFAIVPKKKKTKKKRK